MEEPTMALPGLFVVTLCLSGLAAAVIIGRALWDVTVASRHKP
jgi:hypothetical protein